MQQCGDCDVLVRSGLGKEMIASTYLQSTTQQATEEIGRALVAVEALDGKNGELRAPSALGPIGSREDFEEGGTLIPRMTRGSGQEVDARWSIDRYEVPEGGTGKGGEYFGSPGGERLVRFFAEVQSGYGHGDGTEAEELEQDEVAAGLDLDAPIGGEYQQGRVGQGRSGEHVPGQFLVTRNVNEDQPPVAELDVELGGVEGLLAPAFLDQTVG